jgi:hypothetical protein
MSILLALLAAFACFVLALVLLVMARVAELRHIGRTAGHDQLRPWSAVALLCAASASLVGAPLSALAILGGLS